MPQESDVVRSFFGSSASSLFVSVLLVGCGHPPSLLVNDFRNSVYLEMQGSTQCLRTFGEVKAGEELRLKCRLSELTEVTYRRDSGEFCDVDMTMFSSKIIQFVPNSLEGKFADKAYLSSLDCVSE